MAADGGEVERGDAGARAAVDVGALQEEVVDDRLVAAHRGVVEGGERVGAEAVDLGAVVEEETDDGDLAFFGCGFKRGQAAFAGGVEEVGAVAEEFREPLNLGGFGCGEGRGVSSGGGDGGRGSVRGAAVQCRKLALEGEEVALDAKFGERWLDTGGDGALHGIESELDEGNFVGEEGFLAGGVGVFGELALDFQDLAFGGGDFGAVGLADGEAGFGGGEILFHQFEFLLQAGHLAGVGGGGRVEGGCGGGARRREADLEDVTEVAAVLGFDLRDLALEGEGVALEGEEFVARDAAALDLKAFVGELLVDEGEFLFEQFLLAQGRRREAGCGWRCGGQSEGNEVGLAKTGQLNLVRELGEEAAILGYGIVGATEFAVALAEAIEGGGGGGALGIEGIDGKAVGANGVVEVAVEVFSDEAGLEGLGGGVGGEGGGGEREGEGDRLERGDERRCHGGMMVE
jgi:hypothetical protein